MKVTPSVFNCSNIGANTVTLKVKDVNGNSSTCTAIVTVTGGALFKYVILASHDVELDNRTYVQSGGVGVMSTGGDADIEHYSTVTAAGTFVQGVDINISGGSSVTTQINSVAVAPIPTFENNLYNSNNDVTVSTGQTVTLTDSIYNKIKIAKYGTVIFTQPSVNISKLEADYNATIRFTQCTKFRLKENLDIKKNSQFNPDGLSVTVFVDGSVSVKEGSSVTATIYTKDDDIKVEGKSNNRTTMTDFVGKDGESKGYTDWYASSQCGKCSLSSALFAKISNKVDVNCDGATNGSATVSVTGGTAPYTYSWNNAALQTTATATNLGVGNYTVVVTDALGAFTTATANIEVFSYTLLATESIDIGKNDTVYSGSVGVTSANGDIDIDKNSGVIDGSSIVIAPSLNIDATSTVNEEVYGVASPTTLAYEGNIPYSSNSNLTVANNATVTLSATDTLRKKIVIGDNATLIVTAGRLNITDDLELKKNAKIRFTKCTKVRIKGDLITGDNPTINPDNAGVTFYVNGSKVSIKSKANVNATIYAPNATLSVDNGSSSAQNTLTGQFIAKKITSGYYTKWYANNECPCVPGSGPWR